MTFDVEVEVVPVPAVDRAGAPVGTSPGGQPVYVAAQLGEQSVQPVFPQDSVRKLVVDRIYVHPFNPPSVSQEKCVCTSPPRRGRPAPRRASGTAGGPPRPRRAPRPAAGGR